MLIPNLTIHPGDLLDQFQIESVVATSGMATVFRGIDTLSGRQVAIKVPHPEMESDPAMYDRFKREEEIGTRLDHPGALVDGASLLIHSGHDPALAARLLRRYLDSGSTTEEAPVFKAHLLLGEIFEKQADRDHAAEQYRAALALAHTYHPALEALRRVTH